MIRLRWAQQYDWSLALLGLVIAAAGLVILISATPDPRLWKIQLVWLGVALVLATVLHLFSRRRTLSWAYPLYGISLVLLVGVLILGNQVNGARAWFVLGPLHFQPSELAKIAVILAMARLMKDRRLLQVWDYFPPLLLAAPPIVLTMLEPDLGGAMIMTVAVLGILFIRGLPTRHILVGLGLVVILVPTVVWPHLKPYQQERVLIMLNPSRDPLGAGFQVMQSTIAIGSGGLEGKGYGHGTQSQLGFIPFQSTDFIFAVLAEELGFVGAVGLLLLYAALFYRLAAMARECLEMEDRMVIGGVLSLLAFQVLVNVGVTLGIAPVTGITLPLISYGGTSLVMTFIVLSLVLLIHRDRFADR